MYVVENINIYGAYNSIWQKQFERGDFHVIWYACVLRLWHFRNNNFFYFLFETLIKSVKRRAIWNSDYLSNQLFEAKIRKNYWLESVKSVKQFISDRKEIASFELFLSTRVVSPRMSVRVFHQHKFFTRIFNIRTAMDSRHYRFLPTIMK